MQTLFQNTKLNEAYEAAKLFMYYQQFKNINQIYKIPIQRIRPKRIFQLYKDQFIKLTTIFEKYKLNIEKYIKYFVLELNKRECDIKSELINIKTITEYIDWHNLKNKQNKIYKWFIKTINNIANDCLSLGYFSTKDYFRYLISTKKLAQYYVSGKISGYYLAAIPTFKKIIPKLDKLSRADFHKLYNRFELYNEEITTTIMLKTNQKVNPIKITDDLIFKLRNEKQKTSNK